MQLLLVMCLRFGWRLNRASLVLLFCGERCLWLTVRVVAADGRLRHPQPMVLALGLQRIWSPNSESSLSDSLD
jgi:hypothetical protein